MSKFFKTNNTGSHFMTGVIWDFLTTLIAGGWTMALSSDGVTAGTGIHLTRYSNTGFSTGNYGNANAWVVLQQPSGGVAPYAGARQIMFQRNPTQDGTQGYDGNYMQAYYSKGGLFAIVGAATDRPKATDEQCIFGTPNSGTPGAGWTGNYWLPNADAAGYRYSICVGSVSDADMPVGFWFSMWGSGGGLSQGSFLFDPQTNVDAADTDPFVISQLPAGNYLDSVLGNACKTWFNPAAANSLPSTFSKVFPLTYAANNSQAIPSNVGSSPLTGKEDLLPILFANKNTAGGTAGYKGTSMMLRWVSSQRSTGDTISTTGTASRDRIVIDQAILPWDGSNPLV